MPLDYARIPTEARVWIMQRPPAVRAVIERYPPGVYDVRAGAPYALTGPGTRVVLVAYTEDEGDGGGEQVKVQVLDSTAAGIMHLTNQAPSLVYGHGTQDDERREQVTEGPGGPAVHGRSGPRIL